MEIPFKKKRMEMERRSSLYVTLFLDMKMKELYYRSLQIWKWHYKDGTNSWEVGSLLQNSYFPPFSKLTIAYLFLVPTAS